MRTLLNTQLLFPFQDTPKPGELIEVADSVYWLRMPLPFSLAHINLWLLKDNDNWAIIDTGIKSDETKQLWQSIFQQHLHDKPVTRIILTHLHPDHMGLAQWLTEYWKADLWMTQTEWLYSQLNTAMEHTKLPENLARHFTLLGVDPDIASNMKNMFRMYSIMMDPPPAQYQRISAGDTLNINGKKWTVMIGRGHSPEHACYYCEELKIIIGGDQLLPRITPSISVYPEEPNGNPLGLFLNSLTQFYALPEDCLVLPSHELPYRNVHQRLDQLKQHHEERCDVILNACAEPLTAIDIMRVMFNHRKLSPMDEIMALGETVAHINLLLVREVLSRTINENGLYCFKSLVTTELPDADFSSFQSH